MRPLGAWLGRLTLAGTCLAMAGCGGGVPDPDSDSNAATDQPGQVVAAPAEPSAPAPETPPAADAAPAPGAESPAPAAQAEAAMPAPAEDAAPAAQVASATKGDSSATDELARLAAAPPAQAEAANPSPASSSTTGPAGSETPQPAPGSEAPAASPPAGTTGSPETPAPSSAGMPAPGEASIPGTSGSESIPGAPGGESGGADSGGVSDKEPADFSNAASAAISFLSALKAKDKDRLAQATARRAQTEAVEKHRKIFAAISEGSISDEELDDLAKALDGFRPVRKVPATSTGRIGIVIGKMAGRDYLQRTLTIRHEKEGWKVLDISDMLNFKPTMPNFRGGRRR